MMRIHTPRYYRRRRRLHGHNHPGFAVPFVVGAPRSGTTLLRLMLDAHPEVAIPSETHFIVPVIDTFRRRRVTPEALSSLLVAHNRWGDFHLDEGELLERLRPISPFNAADSIRAFFRLYAEKQGKARWGDKTPGYVKEIRKIARVLPEARFIHIIRDGRDVALSVLAMNWGPTTVTRAAEVWQQRITNARAQAQEVPAYMEVHYEDLVLDTEAALRRVCECLELDYHPAMLAYHERAEERLREKERDLVRRRNPIQPAELRMASHALAKRPPQAARVGRWRSEMSVEDVAEYERIAGDLLSDLGYETGVRAGNGRPSGGPRG